jgi:hypothetical protein
MANGSASVTLCSDTGQHLRLWIDVVQRAQPRHVAAPAALLALVTGSPAMARCAPDRDLPWQTTTTHQKDRGLSRQSYGSVAAVPA